ncbi:hypothetical protein ACFLSE_05785 [Bacteroidota bacterium]
MKKRLLFPVIIIFLATISLYSQENTKDAKYIKGLNKSDFYKHLKDSTNQSENDWIKTDTTKGEVIRRLQNDFNQNYEWWIDRKEFEAYLDSVILTNDVVENEYLKNKLNDTTLSNLKANNNRKNWKTAKSELFFDEWDQLFYFLQLDQNIYDEKIIEANLSWISDHKVLQYLSSIYKNEIEKDTYSHVLHFIKDRNFELIKKRLAVLEESTFVHYKSNETDPKLVKEIDLFMDNDFFTLGGFNQDRDYTGGGALTISTDYMAWRWANLGWFRYIGKNKLNEPHRIVMSYQTLSLGMNFYTPYIRYRNNFALADTLFQYDRPFGSYVYFERNKYRLWPKGLVRHKGSFQVGKIGSYVGRDIQAVLHRDATVESQKVYGWDKQIANGGRWLVQLNHTADVMLFSTTNEYKTIFSQTSKNNARRGFFKDFGFNWIGSGEVMYGGNLSALGGGMKISTSDFTKTGGQKTVKAYSFNKNEIFEFGLTLDLGVRYRYIVHNSLLEGFGYHATHRDDKYDDEFLSAYTLNQDYYEAQNLKESDKKTYPKIPSDLDQLERNIWLIDFGLNLRLRKMTIYWHMTFNTKEFKYEQIDYKGLTSLVDVDDQIFYNDEVISELNNYADRKFYGYGKVGITWLLGD